MSNPKEKSHLQVIDSAPSSALEAIMRLPKPSTAITTKSEAKPSLQGWALTGDVEPPVSEAEALDAAMFGEYERRIEPDKAISIAQRIAASFPYLSRNTDEEALLAYIGDLAEIISRHHPKVVEEVTAGPNRITLSSRFAPTAVELKEAMNRAAAHRFKDVSRARLAVAFYASERCVQVRKDPDWIFAFQIRSGDKALALVREYMEQAQ